MQGKAFRPFLKRGEHLFPGLGERASDPQKTYISINSEPYSKDLTAALVLPFATRDKRERGKPALSITNCNSGCKHQRLAFGGQTISMLE